MESLLFTGGTGFLGYNCRPILDKIYKVTTDVNVAINTYEVHFENSNCYIGTYVNNKLVELGKLYSRRADGPGIFNGAVTMEAIEHYTID